MSGSSGGGRGGAVAAVDLGATSGRVMLGHVGPSTLRLEQVARFANTPVRVLEGSNDDGSQRFGLHWNILGLFDALSDGLATALRQEPGVASVGIDSWAVDYALMQGGRMLGVPYHYRDERTAASVRAVHAAVSAEALYARNGLQHLPFNSLFQFEADRASGDLARADRALLIPDLIAYWLTGVEVAEITNASTTGLLDPVSRAWDGGLLDELDLPRTLLAALIEPGDVIGALLPSLGLGSPRGRASQTSFVTAVGSHDTASAVVAVPSTDPDFAYISSGTWSLVGVEVDCPVITEAGRLANFTNEGGVDRRIRYLKNVSGLWLLSESVRTWERASGTRIDLAALLSEAAAVGHPVSTFDAADDRFIAPGDMPARIAAWCVEHDRPAPQTPAEFTRSIMDSLAEAYATTIEQAAELTGKSVSTIHIVGGGSQNELLCQLTADRSGRPVLAGPVEATAIGNMLVQARAAGLVDPSSSLEALRSLVADAFPPRRYEPRG